MYVLVFGCKKKQKCTHTPFQEGCNTIGVQCNTVGVHDETLYTCGQSNSLKQHTRLAIIHIIEKLKLINSTHHIHSNYMHVTYTTILEIFARILLMRTLRGF